MSDFTFDEKENYSLDDVKNLLKQHRNVVYAESKKNIEPKLSEYETKLKEYENKVNEYQEKELFNGLNDKQIKIAKSLLNDYKDISKTEALEKIKQEYIEIFNNKSNISNTEIIKKEEEKPKEEMQYFNTLDLLKLDNIYNTNQKVNLDTKAKTKGLIDKNEILEYMKKQFSDIPVK